VSTGGSRPPASERAGRDRARIDLTGEAAQGRRVLLFVAGGIAAYKVVEVARSLTQLGADVRVIMSPSALSFVGAQTFASVSGNPVSTELFAGGPDVPHVELARGAELAIVAPATANSLAKMASGGADDLFAATWLMLDCPVLVAPAMHTEMWEHPATQTNVATLVERGATLVGPETGPLVSGDSGSGRMAEPDEIVSAALDILGRARALAGRRVVVTAGGTQEPIDPVRFIGNRSSGLMGLEVARAAARRGAKVTLVGPANLASPPGVDVAAVRTAEEMRTAVADLAPDADVIVKAAAVADFKVAEASPKKLKKAAGPPRIELVPTVDILAELGANPHARKEGSLLVGFAAETESDPRRLAEIAVAKLRAKRADVMVANDVESPDSGFGTRTNRAVLATREGVADAGLVTKAELAEALVDRIVELLEGT
jgi:phosphopantothenoylcysteine decarboxylase/phosphopantothenate--cysteine ligase